MFSRAPETLCFTVHVHDFVNARVKIVMWKFECIYVVIYKTWCALAPDVITFSCIYDQVWYLFTCTRTGPLYLCYQLGSEIFLFPVRGSVMFELKKCWNLFLLGVCVHAIFWSFSETTFRRLWLPKQGFRTESFAKIVVSWKSFLMNSGSGLDKPGHINLWFPRLLVAKVPKPGLNPLFPHCSSPGYLSQGAWALYSQTARRKVAYVTVPEPGYWDCQTQRLIAFNFFWRPHAGIIEIMASGSASTYFLENGFRTGLERV